MPNDAPQTDPDPTRQLTLSRPAHSVSTASAADLVVPGIATTLRLAERFSLTPYEAAYLELAQRHSLPLATLNRNLRAAAPALRIELLGEA
jgi:predicted nucleic acid-binding protein